MTKKFRIKKKFNGMTILSIKNFKDHRGDFLKLFSSLELDNLILNKKIKQVNFVSTKKKGTIRGLHFQIGKFSEYKIFYCIKGEATLVCIDMKKKNNYKIMYSDLSENLNQLIIIPPYFASGYQTKKKNTKLFYLSTAHHKPDYEKNINPLDPYFNVKWPVKKCTLSLKDNNSKFFKN